MNDNYPSGTSYDPNGSAADQHMPVPDTSLLPGSEMPPAPAAQLLGQAVRGAHAGIDRLAQAATPAVLKLGETVAAGEDVLKAHADQWRETGDAWVDELRSTVRRHPLACLAAALALGAVIVRISR